MKHVTFKGEFGYELVLSVPYAYYLHMNNDLAGTRSVNDTKCFYYFSKNHIEDGNVRSPYHRHVHGSSFYELHTSHPDFSRWTPPPYKDIYKNDIFVYDKPIMMVSNKKYSNGQTEQYGSFTTSELEYIFEKYHKDYTIIYNRALSKNIVVDTQLPDDSFDDFDILKKYDVINLNELYTNHSDTMTFNTLQMMVSANCDKFISVQGGSSILSSYFGGTNHIYAQGGKELGVGSFKNWYNKLSGAKIIVSNTFAEFKRNEK